MRKTGQREHINGSRAAKVCTRNVNKGTRLLHSELDPDASLLIRVFRRSGVNQLHFILLVRRHNLDCKSTTTRV